MGKHMELAIFKVRTDRVHCACSATPDAEHLRQCDAWICLCGNRPDLDGFEAWPQAWRCRSCQRVLRTDGVVIRFTFDADLILWHAEQHLAFRVGDTIPAAAWLEAFNILAHARASLASLELLDDPR